MSVDVPWRLIGATPGLDLALVGSSQAEKVQAGLPDVEVIAGPLVVAINDNAELVVIVSPSDSHVPLARAALMARKHVVVDEPFAVILSDTREPVSLAKDCTKFKQRSAQ